MSPSDLARWSGLAAMLAGVLIIISALLGVLAIDFSNLSREALRSTFAFYSLGYLFGGILLLGGLVGLYADQSEAAGPLGVVGFLLAFLGTALFVGVSWDQAVGVPALAVEAPELLEQEAPLGFKLSLWLFSLGWLLFGVATLRAGRYRREAAWLLIAGAVINFIPRPGTEVVLAAAVAWLGFDFFSERGRTGRRTSRRTRRPADRRIAGARGTRDAYDEGERGGRHPGSSINPREEDTWRRPGWRKDMG